MQKAGKRNTVVILGKESYIKKMTVLLSDTSDFERLEISPDKYLKFVINSKDKYNNIIKGLHDKESLTNMLYKKICPVGSHPGILYGQAKTHKPVINNFPSFRTILHAINTLSYKLRNFFFCLFYLHQLLTNIYFEFSKEITKNY